MEKMLMAIRRDLVYNENGVEAHVGEAETVVNVDGKEAARIDWNKGKVIRDHPDIIDELRTYIITTK